MQRITILIYVLSFVILSCKEHKRLNEKEIVEKPAEINKTARDIIKESLNDLISDPENKELPRLKNVSSIKSIYDQNDYEPIWTGNGKWNSYTDSLYLLIDSARYYGLFAGDYYKPELSNLRHRLIIDTSSKQDKLDAALWAKTELYLSDAFIQLIKDLRNGRILQDTTSVRKDSVLTDSFYNNQLQAFKNNSIYGFTSELEPSHSGYQNLKNALKHFLIVADFQQYTYLNPKDSINLKTLALKRLIEDSITIDSAITNDSLKLASAIKKYQKRVGIKQDGKLSSSIIARLNQTDTEKFIRIAITMDRYKQLPAKFPPQYIWVNIPEYYMYLKEDD